MLSYMRRESVYKNMRAFYTSQDFAFFHLVLSIMLRYHAVNSSLPIHPMVLYFQNCFVIILNTHSLFLE